jgi:hypothetical protein
MLGEENMERILSDWLHNLPVTWMAVLFFGCGYLTVAAIYVAVVEFPTSFLVRARALSAAMLSPLGYCLRFSSCLLQLRSGTIMIGRPPRLLRRREHSEIL